MAKIQTLGTGQRIATGGVQVATAPRGGQVEQALLKAGSQVADATAGLLRKREQAEATNFSDNSNRELKLEQVKIQKELDTKYAQDPTGYAEEYNTRMQEAQTRLIDTAPNDVAKNLFEKRSNDFVFSTGLQARTIENRNRSIQYTTKMTQAGTTAGEIFYNNPDSLGASLDIQERQLELQEQVGITIDQKQANALMEDYRGKVRDGILQGTIDREYSNIANARMPIEQRKKEIETFLKGTPETAELFKGMSPAQKNRFKQRAFAQMDASFKKERSHLSERTNLLVNSIAGGTVDVSKPEGRAVAQRQITAIQTSQSLDNFQKTTQIARLSEAMISTDIQSNIALMSDEEASKNLQSIVDTSIQTIKDSDPLIGASLEANVKKKFQNALDQSREEMFKDPVSFFTKHDPTLGDLGGAMINGSPQAYGDFKSQIDAYYDEKNIPYSKRSYLHPSVQQEFNQTFQTAIDNKDFGIAEEIFTRVETMTNGQSYKVMRELDIPQSYIAIGEASGAHRRRLLQTVTESKPINDSFKANPDIYEKDDDIKDKLNNEFYDSLSRQDMSTLQSRLNADEMMKIATLEYKRRRLSGEDEDSATEGAWSAFTADKTLVSGGDTKSSLVIPNKAMVGANPDKIKNFISLTTGDQREFIGKTLDFNEINIPSINQEDKENYISSVAENGFWSYNRADGRVYLNVRRGASNAVVKFKDGREVSYTPQEISEMDFEEDPGWVEKQARIASVKEKMKRGFKQRF